MIADRIENASKYYAMHSLFEQAFEWIRNTDLIRTEERKYELKGTDLFAIVQSYETKPADSEQSEAHKRYIDIQYMISGEEQIGHSFFKNQIASKEYSDEEDYWLTAEEPSFFSKLTAGMFMIFYPTDLHMPCIQSENKMIVKKVVIKVAV